MSADKYTLGEAAGVGGIVTLMLVAMTALGSLFAIILMVAYTWIDLHLYNWFVIPYLHAPPLALLPAAGIVLLVRAIMSMESRPNLKPECLDAPKNKFLWIGVPLMHLMGWLMGAIIHWAIGKGW